MQSDPLIKYFFANYYRSLYVSEKGSLKKMYFYLLIFQKWKLLPAHLLKNINSPDDLKKLDRTQLHQVCDELRQYIIDVVSVHGGHFAAQASEWWNLPLHCIMFLIPLTTSWYGMWAIRLTDTKFSPDAAIIFQQTENTKVLAVSQNDQKVNTILSVLAILPLPFLRRWVWRWLPITKVRTGRQHVAVIGDGAMTAGLAFEAMNHAGIEKSNLLIILNDNCMSIDPNVGALKEYLTDITTSQTYNKFRDDIWKALGKLPVENHFQPRDGQQNGSQH